jgi:hypothetical protein
MFKDTARPHSLGPYALVRPGTPVAWPGNVSDPRTEPISIHAPIRGSEKEHAPLTRLICLPGEQGAGQKFKDLSGSAHLRPRARAIRLAPLMWGAVHASARGPKLASAGYRHLPYRDTLDPEAIVSRHL